MKRKTLQKMQLQSVNLYKRRKKQLVCCIH
uniref:ATATH7 n=1 Tax=Arundo donax TaxID=35708 RepID=A0A0A9EFX8_ARUDO